MHIPTPTSPRLFRRFLCVIFFFSGTAALIYQVVWQRLLTLYYGLGSVSTALIVGAYMLGLGLGAWAGGVISERYPQRLRLYFLIELAIGCFGLISIPLLEFIGHQTAGANYAITLLFCFLYLCIPTFLMGSTLPLLIKIDTRINPDFVDSVSFLYFINTVGAACGAVITSYGLISFGGLDTALFTAVGINFVLAFFILFLLKKTAPRPSTRASAPDRYPVWCLGKKAFLLVFITGFLAIGYEIIWMRVLSILTKNSAYAFSTTLFVYLLGVGFGSWGMNRILTRRQPDFRNLYFSLQTLLAMSVLLIFIGFAVLTLYTPLRILPRLTFTMTLHPAPFWPNIDIPHFSSETDFLLSLYLLTDCLIWPLVFVFIPTLFMGAGFPIITRLALTDQDQEGRTVGNVYFFNILGNVAGALGTGFLLLPFLGTERTLILFISMGLLFIFLIKFRSRAKGHWMKAGAGLLIIAGITFWPLITGAFYDLTFFIKNKPSYRVYFKEGIEGVVQTAVRGPVVHNYMNGMTQGGRPGYYFYLTALETLAHAPRPQDVCQIGLGTASLLEGALMDVRVQNVDVIEINATLIRNLKEIPLFQPILNDSRVRMIIDDVRRHFLRRQKKYDVILTAAPRMTEACMNNINSREFFRLVRAHLKKDGVFMIWAEENLIMPKTLYQVFEHVKVYGSFCLAAREPFQENHVTRRQLLNLFDGRSRQHILKLSQRRTGHNSGAYWGDEHFILNHLQHVPCNTDLKPITEYYLGLGLHYHQAKKNNPCR